MAIRNCHRAHRGILKAFVKELNNPDSSSDVANNWKSVAKKLNQGEAGRRIPVGSLVDNMRPTGYLDLQVLCGCGQFWDGTAVAPGVINAISNVETKTKTKVKKGRKTVKEKARASVSYKPVGDWLCAAGVWGKSYETWGIDWGNAVIQVGTWLTKRSRHFSKAALGRKIGKGLKKGAKKVGKGLEEAGKIILETTLGF